MVDLELDAIKNYKARFHQAIEEVFIDDDNEAASLSDSFASLASLETPKYNRLTAALQIVSKFTPDTIK